MGTITQQKDKGQRLKHTVPSDFRNSANSHKDLEGKLASLKRGSVLEVFIYPGIGSGFLGEGKYSDAVTSVLSKAYEYGLRIAGGKDREDANRLIKEMMKDISGILNENQQVGIAGRVYNIVIRQESALFENSPVKVFLYRKYTHKKLGRFLDYDMRHRMVAEINYRPLDSESTKTIDATEIGLIKVRR